MAKKIVIAGGGPAGLACGIRLKQAGYDVTVHERGNYPLRKVCGEFLSPRGWARFKALGAGRYLDQPPAALRRARFFADDQHFADLRLEPPAFGLSRAALDMALARCFRSLGGDLREGSSFEGDGADVDARGRPQEGGNWLGYKAYLPPSAELLGQAGIDLLMLPLSHGYAGIARIEDGRLSVCLIAQAPVSLKELLHSHPLLAGAADHLVQHAAIAGFNLASYPGSQRIGDASRVWPPVVGDGISRAILGGEAKARQIMAGETSPSEGGLDYRLALGLHQAMLAPGRRRMLLRLCKLWPGLAEAAYRMTRA